MAEWINESLSHAVNQSLRALHAIWSYEGNEKVPDPPIQSFISEWSWSPVLPTMEKKKKIAQRRGWEKERLATNL